MWDKTKKKDLTGKHFGKLDVICEVSSRTSKRRWLCKCKCGQIKSIYQQSLLNGSATSCGIGNCRYLKLDLINFRSGKLVGIRPADNHLGGVRLWEAKCDCGNIWVGRGSLLRKNKVLSCGCLLILSNQERGLYGKLPNKTRNRKFCQKEFDWKVAVKNRDKKTCAICKSKERIVAHHLESFHANIDLRYDINNGVTLCFGCHKKFHSIYGQKFNTKTQFEEFKSNYFNNILSINKT